MTSFLPNWFCVFNMKSELNCFIIWHQRVVSSLHSRPRRIHVFAIFFLFLSHSHTSLFLCMCVSLSTPVSLCLCLHLSVSIYIRLDITLTVLYLSLDVCSYLFPFSQISFLCHFFVSFSLGTKVFVPSNKCYLYIKVQRLK